MNSSELIESFKEFAKLKKIDRPTMIRILEDVFRAMIRKQYGDDENYDVIINVEEGDLEIWRYREIVANDQEDYDENTQIFLTDAKRIEEDFEVGEEVAEEVKIPEFGRRMVQAARQTLIQKVKDLEKDHLFEKYKDRVGEVITGEVYQALSRELVVSDGSSNELTLPKAEQISKDRYRKGDQIRAVINRVEMVNNNPKIILSRTAPTFLERLFEQEVPEIFDGLIVIKKIVREPGERAKVAVESFDDRIDPVGACVGMKGSRIHSIVRELQNENIDVINYTDNLDLYIQRALSPAHINRVEVNEEKKRVAVYLERDQVSLAIGKGGQNIRLASRLVGYEIDVYRELNDMEESEDDIDLSEFVGEIDEWIIDEFRNVGLDSAKSVLALTKDELVLRTDLEDETVEFVLEILKKEFE
ncbi:transcription termination factor NusA [Sediminitomix flava]|uniref:Transcription termination/antitermination protein NusA n=1 Tax=Sediminitomix flava TaxID=379075 RepID=A0A315ZGA8_SEDFL|nr:transcription termination factor NusA [Sediminitomix flava]PWJ44626.1 NusA antitermination factor [Sediminitomix flava]